jgi:hypothetical protein
MIALAALTLWVSYAADIDGKWTAQIQGRRGARTETLMLKATDNGLTGSIEGRGGPVQISNGAIDGANVSFSVIREFQGNKVTEDYKGTVSGGELKLTVSGGRGGPTEVTYKKQ